MSNYSLFLKKNKKVRANTKVVATKSYEDENGKPVEWEIRAITTKENDQIREDCTIEVQVTGKPHVYRPKVNSSKYVAKMVAASVVFPDLYDAQLQDSYSVCTPEALLQELVDDPGEFNEFAAFVQNYNGFEETMEEKVDEAKN